MGYKTKPTPGAGVREFFKVVPSTASEATSNIDKHLTSLADLTQTKESDGSGVLGKLSRSKSQEPVTFEFLALSQGEGEPVNLYYSSSGRQETLKKRLKAIYPSSFEIKKVHLDLGHQLIEPIKLTEQEFRARLKADQLYRDREEYLDTNLETTTGGAIGDGREQAKLEPGDTVAEPGIVRAIPLDRFTPHSENTAEEDADAVDTDPVQVESDGGATADDTPTPLPDGESNNGDTQLSSPFSVGISKYENKVNPIALTYIKKHEEGWHYLDGDPFFAPADQEFSQQIQGQDRTSNLVESIDLTDDDSEVFNNILNESGSVTPSLNGPSTDANDDAEPTATDEQINFTLPHHSDSFNPIACAYDRQQDNHAPPEESDADRELQVGDNTIKFVQRNEDNYIGLRYFPNLWSERHFILSDEGNGQDNSEANTNDEHGENTADKQSKHPLVVRAPDENELLTEQHDETEDSGTDEMLIIDDEDEDGTPIRGIVWLNPPEEVPDNEPLATLEGPTLTEDGHIYARPDLEYTEPNAVRWYGRETAPYDWMTTLDTATESNPEYEDGSVDDDVENPDALETLFSHLEEAKNPTAYQAVFRKKPSWESQAQSHKQDIRRGEFNEPLLEKLFPAETDQDRDLKAYEYRRIKLIENKRPTETFNVNLRAISLAPKPDFTNDPADPTHNPHEKQAEIRETLHTLTPLFDPLDGIYYSIEGEVADKRKSRTDFSLDPTADVVVTNFFERELTLREDLRGALTPLNITNDPKKHVEIVMNGRELGEFIIIPSGDDMDSDVFRSTGVRDKDIEPLTRPRPEIHKKFSDGMALGYAYDERGRPEKNPTCLPEGKLPNHWAMFGSSGSGKTVNAISMLLSAHRDTDGPVILVDPKEGNMIENYCKSHYGTFGDLRDVYVFDVPDVLPAIPFFDIRPYLYEGMDRDNAIQQKVDEFHLILQMIDENYGTAYVAKTVLGALIKSQFDAEHGSDAYTLDDLYETAVGMYANQRVPRVSHQPQVRNILTSQLNNSESEFKNTMQAVINRLDDLQEDINLYHLFNQKPHWDEENGVYKSNSITLDNYDPDNENSKPPMNALDFRKILDEDVVILFDTGDFVRDQSQQAFSMYILSALWGRVRSRYKDRQSHETIDSTVKLVIEESAPIVSTELVTNTLIPEGREFGLSLGMIMQFPDQVSDQGVGGSFNELKTNVQTKIYGQIDPNRQIADSLIHGDKDASAIKNKIRRLRGGEWIVQLPEPEFGVDVPPPFSLQSLDIPPGHPAGHESFDDSERSLFYKQFEQRLTKTAKEHGITQDERNIELPDPDDDEVNVESEADAGDGSEPHASSEATSSASDSRSSPAEESQSESSDSTGESASTGETWGNTFSAGEGDTARIEDKAQTKAEDTQQPATPSEQSSESGPPTDFIPENPGSSADSEPPTTKQQDPSTGTSDVSEASGDTNSFYDNVEPLPREQIADICDQTNFDTLDGIQSAVFLVEGKYHPVQQPDIFQRALKRLAVEAQEHGQDITASELEKSLSQSGNSVSQRSDGDVTVDDIDATDDAGIPDANEVETAISDEDSDGTVPFQRVPRTSESPSGSNEPVDTAESSASPKDESQDSTSTGPQRDDTGENTPDTTTAGTQPETGSESIEPDSQSAAESSDKGTNSESNVEDNNDSTGLDLGEWKLAGGSNRSAEDVVDSLNSDSADDDSSSSQPDDSDETGDETSGDRADNDTDTAETGDGTGEEHAETDTGTVEEQPHSPADVSLKSPLSDDQTLLAKHKRESVDLSKDDIKFLALVADAFRDDLEGYSLHDSMKQLESRAGNPDIAGLEEDGYIEPTKIHRRKYYSLTRKAWRLVNDGVPGNKFGDHMEKITHRYGVYLTARFLETFSGLSAVEYESLDGETYDVVSYDESGDICHVCEIETRSNNKEAVIEDYHKLAEAPGESVWIFPQGDIGGEVRAKLETEDLVEETSKTVKAKPKQLYNHVKSKPAEGMTTVQFYPRLREKIGI